MEIKNITEYFNKKTEDVRKDFTEDMRRITQLRARDKTDQEIRFAKNDDEIERNATSIRFYVDYFRTLAQAVSILTENTNM